MKSSLKIRQIRSSIGQVEQTRLILKGLGLGRIGKEKVVENTPSFRGMIKKVIHLISIDEIESRS